MSLLSSTGTVRCLMSSGNRAKPHLPSLCRQESMAPGQNDTHEVIVINETIPPEQSAPPVTLAAVLAAKESRAAARDELIGRRRRPVISLTINMPGPYKSGPEITSLLYTALTKLRQRLDAADCELLEETVRHPYTGPFALLAVAGDAAAIKRLCMALEDQTAYGRLLDIDVFDADGGQISRTGSGFPPRSCFICPRPAAQCVRTQAHSPADILLAAKKYLAAYQAAKTSLWPQPVVTVATTALEAMLMEAACTPAPGLVDRYNSGAHQDMDFFTFIKSSSALNTAMYRFAQAGWEHGAQPPELLTVLRLIGLEAEAAMFKSTGGINTQKGLLFLLGILTASAAFTIRRQPAGAFIDNTLAFTAAVCGGLVERELEILHSRLPDRKLTAGERLFLSHGIAGIRGELAAGLPLVKIHGLPALRSALSANAPLNDALVHALLAIMTVAEDSTIFNRHGLDVLRTVQCQASVIWQAGGMLTADGRQRLAALDQTFIAARISPGGSADLLACTYFLHTLDLQLQT